jgi:hypothetical protein
MTRYRLITPHGMYARGTILDTELPPQRPFSIAEPAAKRLCELGVMEPLEAAAEPALEADEPGWSQAAARPARLDASGDRRQATGDRSSSSAPSRRKP